MLVQLGLIEMGMGQYCDRSTARAVDLLLGSRKHHRQLVFIVYPAVIQ